MVKNNPQSRQSKPPSGEARKKKKPQAGFQAHELFLIFPMTRRPPKVLKRTKGTKVQKRTKATKGIQGLTERKIKKAFSLVQIKHQKYHWARCVMEPTTVRRQKLLQGVKMKKTVEEAAINYMNREQDSERRRCDQ